MRTWFWLSGVCDFLLSFSRSLCIYLCYVLFVCCYALPYKYWKCFSRFITIHIYTQSRKGGLKGKKFTSRFIKINYKITKLLFNDRYDVEDLVQLLCGVFANFILRLQIFFAISTTIANLVIHLPINLICFWRVKIPLESACFVVIFFLFFFLSIFTESFRFFYWGRCMWARVCGRVTLIEDEYVIIRN